MDGKGFSAADWATAQVFTGRCASVEDVNVGRAVFALGDTVAGEAFEEPMPQPAIWYDDGEGGEGAMAALIVQAEIHETDDGERLEVLGLLLPSGETRIAFVEDVEEVDGGDPAWLDLIDADRENLDEGGRGADLTA